MAESLAVFAPGLPVLTLPAWDCLPYDRVSPRAEIVARRIKALSDLLAERPEDAPPVIVLTTVNAALQRVPDAELIKAARWNATPGNIVDIEALQKVLNENGFSRTGTVVDPGDYAMRGGIVDIFPPGAETPVRLDFFGDVLDGARRFEVETQRTVERVDAVELLIDKVQTALPLLRQNRRRHIIGRGLRSRPLRKQGPEAQHQEKPEIVYPAAQDGILRQ